MKNKSLIIFCIFIVCYGNYNAQNYIELASSGSNKEKTIIVLNPQNNSMPNWQKEWTKESVMAINKIIKEHGYPDEISPNRMFWIIPGKIERTITYTENLWIILPYDTISSNKETAALHIKNK